jgi:hypothetical protein
VVLRWPREAAFTAGVQRGLGVAAWLQAWRQGRHGQGRRSSSGAFQQGHQPATAAAFSCRRWKRVQAGCRFSTATALLWEKDCEAKSRARFPWSRRTGGVPAAGNAAGGARFPSSTSTPSSIASAGTWPAMMAASACVGGGKSSERPAAGSKAPALARSGEEVGVCVRFVLD